MNVESIIIDACITIFALGLLIVSLLSYRKYKNTKLIFVSLVFLVFFLKGIMLSISLFYEQLSGFISNPYFRLLDLFVLILLFIATLKR